MKRTTRSIIAGNWIVVVYLIFILGLHFGCAVQLVANYDQITDNDVTSLQKRVDIFLADLERSLADRESFESFYDGVRSDIKTIRIRASLIEKNEGTLDQLGLLSNAVDALESLHQDGFSAPVEVQVLRSGFDVIFTSIIALELAKKRGGEK